MAKNKQKEEEVIVDVEEVYSKTESFINDNKNTLSGIVIGLIVIIGGYFSYQNFYLAPLQEEAQEEMFMAEKYFAIDSMNLAIYGDGVYAGFLEITDNYGGTKAGNLAHYYLGIAFLRTGQFEAAITELKEFDGKDEMLGPLAIGAMGDAFMELGDLNQALDRYEEAASHSDNEFTSPMFLKKAAATHEILGNYSDALEHYVTIKEEYQNSAEATNIEKFIAKAEALNK